MAIKQKKVLQLPLEEPDRSELHPEGKLCLADGTLLTSYNRLQPEEPKTPEECRRIMELFSKNAFFFLSHSKEILSDSRMFLAPVYVSNNLAYTGTSGLKGATLGVYIEWWLSCERTLQEADSENWLVWFLAGSPLSGSNKCSMANERGMSRVVSLSDFRDFWTSFMAVNGRYQGVRDRYESYTLDQALAILTTSDSETTDTDPVEAAKKLKSLDIENFCLRQQATLFKKWFEEERKLSESLSERLLKTTIALHEDEAKEFLAEYMEIKEKAEGKYAELKEELRQWRARLKRGELTNVQYQQSITHLTRELRNQKYATNYFLSDNSDRFPEGVTIYDIINYFDNKNQESK